MPKRKAGKRSGAKKSRRAVSTKSRAAAPLTEREKRVWKTKLERLIPRRPNEARDATVSRLERKAPARPPKTIPPA
jgi:hypothetical protein